MNNCYELPKNRPVVINFSGGRSSAYMLYRILDHYQGDLPRKCYVCFQNTGCEHPATYDFVYDIQERWEVPIVWLEYWVDWDAKGTKGKPNQKHKVVNYETASRNMQPFKDMIEFHKYLPSLERRICTQNLKVKTLDYWCVREKRYKKRHSVLGIRADEMKRFEKINNSLINKKSMSEISRLMPLVYDGVTKEDVNSFWKSHSFDLEIDSDLSNCLFCFLKTERNVRRAADIFPKLAKDWSNLEQMIGERHFGNQYFRVHKSMEQIIEEANSQNEFDFTLEEWSGGDCFCGD